MEKLIKLDCKELAEHYVNLADASLGAVAIFATDDFFAAKERMLNPAEPEWKEGVYDEQGKWMDGWESRRKREHGHDYCIVQLSGSATIMVIDIDTHYFTGNYPPVASVEACHQESDPDDDTQWIEIISPSPIEGDRHNLFKVNNDCLWTHLRLNIFPDGGVARLRVYGMRQDSSDG